MSVLKCRLSIPQFNESDCIQVVFAGYTIPHPSEEIMHLRIQTMDGYPAQVLLN